MGKYFIILILLEKNMLEIICYVTTIAVNLVLLSVVIALGIALYLKHKRSKEAIELFRRGASK